MKYRSETNGLMNSSVLVAERLCDEDASPLSVLRVTMVYTCRKEASLA